MSGWTKREVDTNLVILGDGEGNVIKAAGLLAGITPDRRYPDNKRYELVQIDGTSRSVAGSASINSQLGTNDIGRFIKLTFMGWEKGGNGKYKKIDVEVYEGEPTPAMKNWPRYLEIQNKANGIEPAPMPQQPAEDDSDLPFD